VVLEAQGDVVARLETERAEDVRDPVGLGVELAVRDDLPGTRQDHGGRVGGRLGVGTGEHGRAR
jgi:hypothetical protein